MYFATAGVETAPYVPVLAAFVISFFCSMAGISGAFLLLPFQISFLGYVTPGVSATNHIFNVIACPAGVWRYAREGRLLLPLALFVALGTLPGVFLGALIRLSWLREVNKFLIFVSLTLLYIGLRLCLQPSAGPKGASPGQCRVLSSTWRGFDFSFGEAVFTVRSAPLLALSFTVGLIGGIYGIGGGAIMVPFLVALFGLPVHAIAGASLFATFLTSTAAVLSFGLLSHGAQAGNGPDWALGALFGLGGVVGMYCGAFLQKYAPPRLLRLGMSAVLLFIAITYLIRGLSA